MSVNPTTFDAIKASALSLANSSSSIGHSFNSSINNAYFKNGITFPNDVVVKTADIASNRVQMSNFYPSVHSIYQKGFNYFARNGAELSLAQPAEIKQPKTGDFQSMAAYYDRKAEQRMDQQQQVGYLQFYGLAGSNIASSFASSAKQLTTG